MKKIVFALLLLIHPCVFSQGATPRIVGGEDASRLAYPWMVALLDASESDVFQAQNCGGTLIRSDVVLTAAHCIEDVDISTLDVVIGAYNLLDVRPSERIDVVDVIIHPAYNTYTIDNDIALLKLAEPSSRTPVALVDLATMGTVNVDTPLTTIGWGALDGSDYPRYPVILQQVDLPYVSSTYCQTLVHGVTDNMLCAGVLSGGKDACGGDSGGPLIYRYGDDIYQVGIVSWGEGCAERNKPGVFTRLVNYVDWIDQILTSLYVPEVADLGSPVVGASVAVGIVLKNWSNETITVLGVSDVTGGSGLVSSRISDNCGELASGQWCSVVVNLNPTVGGRSETVLNVELSDLSGRTVIVSGNVLGSVDVVNALGENDWEWFSGKDAVWHEAVEGDRTVLRSGSIGDSQNTLLITYLPGPATVAFDWRVSSEKDFDILGFFIDGEPHSQISGLESWHTQCVTLGEGVHELKWSYYKDGDTAIGEDGGAIDSVRLIPEGETSPCTVVGNSGVITFSNNKNSGGGGALSWWALLLLVSAGLSIKRSIA